MARKTRKTRGVGLRVGQWIEVWWAGKNNTDMITELRPYHGPLAYLFPAGAQLAEFRYNRGGMTIDNSDFYRIVTQ